MLSQFASCAAGDVSPLQAVIGGMAAQEVMKVNMNIEFFFLIWEKSVSLFLFLNLMHQI